MGRGDPGEGAPGAVARRALISILLAAAVVVLLLFTWHARQALLLLFAAILLGIFLRRLALLVRRLTRLPVVAALAAVVLLLGGILVTAVWSQGDTIADEAARLGEDLPGAVDDLRARIARSPWGRRLIEEAPEARALVPDPAAAVAEAGGVLSGTVGAITGLAFVLFLGVVLAGAPGIYQRGFLALFPARREPRMREVLARLGDILWWWLIGRLISMTVIGVVTMIGLALLDVPLGFILALLAALLSFIPNLGPVLASVPAILLGLVQGPETALWVILL